MEYNLDPILEYQMNEDEAVAYKIGLLWMAISSQVIPNYKYISSFPKKGDPRKSSLFRYCHTFMNRTKGLIDPKDYKLYIAAQLQMLKAIEIGNLHPNIGPWCLIGDKAWTRWKIWKRKYDNVGKSKSLKEAGLETASFEEVKKELDKTKKFIISKFGNFTEESFKSHSKDIERYISLGMICGFYAALSPWTVKYCKLENIDLNYYSNVSEEALNYFHKVFQECNI